MAYYLEHMTVKDMIENIKTVKTIILPVGVIEQHGYHLPLGTDIYNATEVANRAGEKLEVVIAPAIPYCYSGGELPGTINVSPQVFSLLIMDICSEFIKTGFKNIVVLLGHAGTDNKAALKTSLQMMLKRSGTLEGVTVSMVECWELSPTWLDFFRLEPEHDFHAGWVETSLMMHWKPELVGKEIVMDDPETSRMMRSDQDWFEIEEKNLDHRFIIQKLKQRDEIKVGVMGFPEKATAELGRKICDEMVEGLIAYINLLDKSVK